MAEQARHELKHRTAQTEKRLLEECKTGMGSTL